MIIPQMQGRVHQDLVCCAPGCEAAPVPEFRLPLCKTCAMRASVQYVAMYPPPARQHDLPEVPEREPRASFVYFVRFGDRIKIGVTTNLKRRLAEIPHDEILGTVPGTYRDEQRCHAAFAHIRITGEWFEDSPELRAFITDVTSAAA